MLEIFALWFFCTRIGEMLRRKGWERPFWMQVLVVVTWFGSEFFGGVVYAVYVGVTEGQAAAENLGFAVYPIALVSALIGVGLVFWVAKILPPKDASPSNPPV